MEWAERVQGFGKSQGLAPQVRTCFRESATTTAGRRLHLLGFSFATCLQMIHMKALASPARFWFGQDFRQRRLHSMRVRL